jgi:hypothetical protein
VGDRFVFLDMYREIKSTVSVGCFSPFARVSFPDPPYRQLYTPVSHSSLSYILPRPGPPSLSIPDLATHKHPSAVTTRNRSPLSQAIQSYRPAPIRIPIAATAQTPSTRAAPRSALLRSRSLEPLSHRPPDGGVFKPPSSRVLFCGFQKSDRRRRRREGF